jgi:hypothetical protein
MFLTPSEGEISNARKAGRKIEAGPQKPEPTASKRRRVGAGLQGK